MGPAHLSPDDRARLARVLGMLGSNHPGERAAAALLADRIRSAAGLTWDALILPPAPCATRPEPPDLDDLALRDWRATAAGIAGNRGWLDRLNPWQIDFIVELQHFPELSPRQIATLAKILARLRAGGCAV